MPSKQPAMTLTRFIVMITGFLVLSLIVLLNFITVKPAFGQLLDFGSFIAAGREAAAGDNPYESDSPLVYSVQSQNTDQTLASPNLNPPLSILFFRRIAGAEPGRAAMGWRMISAALFAIGIGILGWQYREFVSPLRILWGLCLAGFWNTIALGQIYAPIFLLTVGAWIFMIKERYVIAGILLGTMIAVKPNFIFWLVLLGLAGYARVALSALGTILVLSILPLFVFGSQIYRQWIAALLDYPSLGLMIAGNSSLQSLASRLGYESLGMVFVMILIGFTLYHVNRHKSSLRLEKINSLGIVSSILISPFSWPGYTVLTLPIFFSMQRWDWTTKIASILLVFPYVAILYFYQGSAFSSIFFGWLYGWGLLLILPGILVDSQPEVLRQLAGAESEN